MLNKQLLIQPKSGRWSFMHKQWLILCVDNKVISMEDITKAGITEEEFAEWRRRPRASSKTGREVGRKRTKLTAV